MTKAKTNALDALRSLIAERQQYEQWITSLDARREGTPEHVFERVKADYQTRLERVLKDIGGHAEELQLSISTLSSRLVEVAREEDTRREGLQEAELRAAVGEYEPAQWEQLKGDSERELDKIAADRASLDNQLSELRGIQKLSEAGSTGSPAAADTAVAAAPVTQSRSVEQAVGVPVGTAAQDQVIPDAQPPEPTIAANPVASHAPIAAPATSAATSPEVRVPTDNEHPSPQFGRSDQSNAKVEESPRPIDQGRLTLDPVATAASDAAASASRQRPPRTPPGGVSTRPKPEPPRADSAKTLKCPECGTPNHATEWYCERCGGELATM